MYHDSPEHNFGEDDEDSDGCISKLGGDDFEDEFERLLQSVNLVVKSVDVLLKSIPNCVLKRVRRTALLQPQHPADLYREELDNELYGISFRASPAVSECVTLSCGSASPLSFHQPSTRPSLPATTPTTAPTPAASPPNPSLASFDAAQISNQPRIPWNWTTGKTTQEYAPTVQHKWWSVSPEEWAGFSVKRKHDVGHIGRIMETDLGEMRTGTDRCTACQEENEECWVYSEKGAKQVSRPGSTCAHCRYAARRGGCSLSTRAPNRSLRRSPRGPGPRSIVPRGGPPTGG